MMPLQAWVLFFILTALILPARVWSVQCGEACTSNVDCQPSCPFCDVGFTDACIDCCVFGDNATCTTNFGCVWDAGSTQCRNDIGTACAASAPEIPDSLRYWVISALAFGIAFFFGKRKRDPDRFTAR